MSAERLSSLLSIVVRSAPEDPAAAVLVVTGELDASSAGVLRSAVTAAIGSGYERVEIDLSSVNFIDAAGVGALLGAQRWLREEGGSLSLCSVSRAAARVFAAARVNHLFATGAGAAAGATSQLR